MMNHDSDGMDEAAENASRLGIAASIQVIEALTRRLEEIARQAREDLLRGQVEAELGLHRAVVRETVEDLREATAGTDVAVRGAASVVDPNAPAPGAGGAPLTREELRERLVWASQYDIRSMNEMQAAYRDGDTTRFQAAFGRASAGWEGATETQRQWVRETIASQRARFEAEEERWRGGDELDESQRLGIEAAQADDAGKENQAREAEAESERLYDSADRRLAVAAELEASGADVEVIESRTLSDTAQARPAREAVTATATKRTRPRGRVPATSRTAELGR